VTPTLHFMLIYSGQLFPPCCASRPTIPMVTLNSAMTNGDSNGARAMRDLAIRLKDFAAEVADPNRQWDIRQAAELLLHLEKLTLKLSRPAQIELGSGRRP
jgi:hypothetical protein